MLRQIALAAGVAIVAGLVLQTWRVGQLQDRNDALESTVAGYREAARFHAEYVRRREEINRDTDEVERDLQEMEGRNDALSDHLRGAANRLWSTP
jgi:chromosome condensin MukBEF ATPase and DNA-binding subunit MukB